MARTVMFPARAGMSRGCLAGVGELPNVPRASGDEPLRNRAPA